MLNICPHFTFPNLFPTVQHYSASRDARLNYFMFTIFILLPFSIFRTLSTIVLDFLLVILLIFKPYIFLRTPQQIPSALEAISYSTSEIPPSSELPCPLYLFFIHDLYRSVFYLTLYFCLWWYVHFTCLYPVWGPRGRLFIWFISLCLKAHSVFSLVDV